MKKLIESAIKIYSKTLEVKQERLLVIIALVSVVTVNILVLGLISTVLF